MGNPSVPVSDGRESRLLHVTHDHVLAVGRPGVMERCVPRRDVEDGGPATANGATHDGSALHHQPLGRNGCRESCLTAPSRRQCEGHVVWNGIERQRLVPRILVPVIELFSVELRRAKRQPVAAEDSCVRTAQRRAVL